MRHGKTLNERLSALGLPTGGSNFDESVHEVLDRLAKAHDELAELKTKIKAYFEAVYGLEPKE